MIDLHLLEELIKSLDKQKSLWIEEIELAKRQQEVKREVVEVINKINKEAQCQTLNT